MKTNANQLVSLMDDIWQVTENIDLCYSSLDSETTGKGWYFMNFKVPGNTTMSQSFRTDTEALNAFYHKKVKYTSN